MLACLSRNSRLSKVRYLSENGVDILAKDKVILRLKFLLGSSRD